MKKYIASILIGLAMIAVAPLSAKAQAIVFPNRGGTGTSTVPSYGNILVGTANGVYQLQATSTLGLPTLDSQNTFSGTNIFNGTLKFGTLNGPIDARAGFLGATSSVGVLYGGTGLTAAGASSTVLTTDGTVLKYNKLTVGNFENVNISQWTNNSGYIVYPFSPTTNYNSNTNATTGIAWFQSGLQASSTSQIAYASTTMISSSVASTSALFGAGLVDCQSGTSLISYSISTGHFGCAPIIYPITLGHGVVNQLTYWSTSAQQDSTSSPTVDAVYATSTTATSSINHLTTSQLNVGSLNGAITGSNGFLNATTLGNNQVLVGNGTGYTAETANTASSPVFSDSNNNIVAEVIPTMSSTAVIAATVLDEGQLAVATGTPGIETYPTLRFGDGHTAGGVIVNPLDYSTTTGNANYSRGNFGIGTSTSLALLWVNKSGGVAGNLLPKLAGDEVAVFQNSASHGVSSAIAILASGDSGARSTIYLPGRNDSYFGNSGEISYEHTSNYLEFVVNGATSTTMTSNGNVGVGTTSPYAKFSVVGSTGVVADHYVATTTTATSTFAGKVSIGNTDPLGDSNTSLFVNRIQGQKDTALRLTGGQATVSDGGSVLITGTNAVSSGNGGDITFKTGSGSNTGTPGNYLFYNNQQLSTGELDFGSLTANRIYSLPDKSGTIAMTSDIVAGAFPFTSTTYGSQAANSTSTALWATGSPLSLVASSTFSTFASTTVFSNSGSTYLATDGVSNVGIRNSAPTSQLVIGTSFTGVTGAVLTAQSAADSIAHFETGNNSNYAGVNTYDRGEVLQGSFLFAGPNTSPLPGSVIVGSRSASPLYLITGGFNPRVTITSTGNVGVATTSPWAKFSIGTVDQALSAPAFVVASSSTGVATTTQFVIVNGSVGVGTTTPWGQLSVNPNAIGSGPELVVGSSTATHFIVKTNGNTGVGTSSPFTTFSVNGQDAASYYTAVSGTASTLPYASSSAITVSGAAYFPSSSSINSSGLLTLGGNITFGSAGATITSGDANHLIVMGDTTAFTAWNNFTFTKNNGGANTMLTIGTTASANVGVGTTTPFKAFSVEGAVGLHGLSAFATGDSAVCQRSGGEITVDSGVSSCTVSSRTVKHDILDTQTKDAIARIIKLNPVSFKYNGTNKPDLGLIAEDVATVDTRYAQYSDATHKPAAINWSAITSDLVKTVQNIIARITGLEKRVNEQDKKIQTLEDRLNKLENEKN